MAEMVIEKGIVIDSVENVAIAIRNLTGKKLDDPEVIKCFATNEKNTYFYLDDKLNSTMTEDSYTSLLWIDTGFVTWEGKPIFVSLRKTYDGYKGHYTGTMKTLRETSVAITRKNKSVINTNYGRFVSKYDEKIKERNIKHIEDVNEYYISVNNRDSVYSYTAFANVDTKNFIETYITDDVEEEIVEEIVEEKEELNFNELEEEVTVSYLLDTFDKMNAYIKELQNTIEELTKEKALSDEKNAQLESMKKAIEQDMVAYREAVSNVQIVEKEYDPSMKGHNLLNHNKKVLVVGDFMETRDCRGITKAFGFENTDFEYETDYEKVKNMGYRLRNSGRYEAVIMGPVPHKVKGMGDESSFIQAMKSTGIVVVEARNSSGDLRLCKDTFKKAMKKLCVELEMNKAC